MATTQRAIVKRKDQDQIDVEPVTLQPIRSGVNISQTERTITLIGGGVLLFFGIKKSVGGSLALGSLLTLLGGGFVYRGIGGHSDLYRLLDIRTVDDPMGKTIQVVKNVTINKPIEDVYRFWRNFENLPRFMTHLSEVQKLDDKRSHWVTKSPFGGTVAWDAELIVEQTNRMIVWRSLENAEIENEGIVEFKPAPGNRGTEVKVSIKYGPPAGKFGVIVAKIFGEEPDQQIKDDLLHFKQIMETGEIPTTEGQPSGQR